ncbi:MICOS complex subunit mic25a isoform X1 [Chelmon rostratus]|uniref:MICOS complex subunit mic25a isoform X1 n=1 Tax=Chelmon rostratus TaxID=109905 RepID=UPI001BE6BD88|nr:MICOS complex subunit mic25a isoform X1 [Chelmon rostratus]
MGSGESTTRKVSFGVDDEDRVRILRGVKLSEDVLQRMRGVANIAPERISSTSVPQKGSGTSGSSGSSSSRSQSPRHRAQPSTQSNSSKSASYAEEEQKRYERQQTILKEELAKMAQRESDAAREMTKAMSRERLHTRQEAKKAKQLAQQLQKKDAQLKALDAFYKEQLAQLEQRNLERYKQSKEQFHQAASETEANVSQYRPGVFWPAGSDFILLQGEQGPDPKVLRPGQRIHAVYRCCKEEPAGQPRMNRGRKRVKQLSNEGFYFGTKGGTGDFICC